MVNCYQCGEFGYVQKMCRSNERAVESKEREKSMNCSLLSALNRVSLDQEVWCLDSGATSYMCCDKNKFTQFEEHTDMIMTFGTKAG